MSLKAQTSGRGTCDPSLSQSEDAFLHTAHGERRDLYVQPILMRRVLGNSDDVRRYFQHNSQLPHKSFLKVSILSNGG
jgi:hypothetical protein